MHKKNLDFQAVELKFDDEGRKFSGYASVFNGVDSYGDTIIKGAYEKTLASRERPIQMRWNHYGPVIGKWVRIEEDEKGLFVEGELTPNHSVADDAYALLKHGAIDGLSIGFYPKKWAENAEKGTRELEEIELVEISIVETPADIAAKIGSVKAVIEDAESPKDYERILRDAGFSRSDAVALVSGIKAMYQSDSDAKAQEAAAIAGIFQQFKTSVNR